MKKDWNAKLDVLVASLSGEIKDFAAANVETVRNACKGAGPDPSHPDPLAGIRYVVNIASVHVPSFCEEGYKNGYDLKKYRVGEQPKSKKPKTRELVDDALPVVDPSNIYFGAAALNGSGIRFYGDICIVLKGDAIPDNTCVLDRNSYDLVRKPFSEELNGEPDKLEKKAKELSGQWSEVEKIAAIKAVFPYSGQTRRMTSGQISSEILNDEDYIEVLKAGRFSHQDVESARISSEEAASANHIEFRQTKGPPATAAELLYVTQRRQAIKALTSRNISVSVSTTSGRLK